MDSKALFLQTRPVRLFFIAAIPGIISMLASSLYGLLDGIFVGRILGDTAFAALNLAFPFVVINFSLADLIGVGAAVPISIQLGQKKDAAANNIFTCACLMIVGTGAAMGALLYAAAPALLRLLGAEGELAAFAVRYVRVYALCSPITTIVFAMDNFLKISGKIRRSMWLNIFMSVLTALLEFLFLYLFRWDIGGAAFATCCGMIAAVLLALYPFARGRLQLRFCRPHFQWSMVRRIFACGTPNFLNTLAGRFTSILMNTVLLRISGADAVAIYGILMYIGEMIQPILYGICDSMQPAIGYNWGARQYGRVKALSRCCFIATAIVSLLSALLIALFPAKLAALFTTSTDPVFMQTAVFALQLFATTHLTRWFSFTTQSYLSAVEQPAYASILSISTDLIFPVLLVILLWPLGLTGIWLNFSAGSILAGLLALLLMSRFRKELKARMEKETIA